MCHQLRDGIEPFSPAGQPHALIVLIKEPAEGFEPPWVNYKSTAKPLGDAGLLNVVYSQHLLSTHFHHKYSVYLTSLSMLNQFLKLLLATLRVWS